MRVVGEKVIVARPLDGAPVVLDRTARLLWEQLSDCVPLSRLDRCLAEAFPAASDAERAAARRDVVERLMEDDLVERC
jgi:hypothetical protein